MKTRFYSDENITFQDLKQNDSQNEIIKWAQSQYRDIDYQSRLKIALEHFNNALHYRLPRVNISADQQDRQRFKYIEMGYNFQTSQYWRKLLLLLSYIFMFIIIMSHRKPNSVQLSIQIIILFLLWIDLIIQFLHRCFISGKATFISLRIYGKLLIVLALTVDQIIAIMGQQNLLRPFLFFRATLPFFYNAQLRKNFQSFASLYKDILVYIIFYSLVLVFFSIIANQIIQIPKNVKYDQFTENYGNLGKAIFLFYVLSSYDSFPDFQLNFVKNQPSIIILFVVFIFFNILLFSTVPTSYLFKTFRQYHSRSILIDQIKQQHSLVLAFIALSEEGELKITQRRFLTFLFAIYKNNMRYVGYITEICVKVNNPKFKFIQMPQFIQLCKVIQSKSSMIPPTFNDWPPWVRIYEKVNSKFGLKAKVRSNKFVILVALIVLISIVNSFFIFYYGGEIFNIINTITTVLFCLEFIVKILGLGFLSYFRETLNKFDFLIIAAMVALEIVDQNVLPHNLKAILNLIRFYKLPLLGKIFAEKRQYIKRNEFYIKTSRLISQIIITFPIVISFFPVFIITAYFLGVLGMTIFSQQTLIKPEESPYSRYDDLANFNSFYNTQFLMVQVLIEAGWSSIAIDHAYRSGKVFLSLSFFVCCHLLLVFLIVSITKGIIWQIYNTVQNELNEKMQNQVRKQDINAKLIAQRSQLAQISNRLQYRKSLNPNTAISRAIIQRRLDEKILEYMINENSKKGEIKITLNIGDCYCKHPLSFDFNYIVDQIDDEQRRLLGSDEALAASRTSFEQRKQSQQQIDKFILEKLKNEEQIQYIEDIHKEDIENYCNILADRLNVNLNDYPIFIWCPIVLQKYLKQKLILVYSKEAVFQLNSPYNILSKNETVLKIKSQLNSLMMIKNTKNVEFLQNLASVIREQCGMDVEVQKILDSYQDKTKISLDSKWILRKTFLANTSEKLIKKFQFEYFSHVYPQNFGHSAKNRQIQPLIRQESKLTHCLRNLLRFRMIRSKQFFQQLSAIESKLSSTILKKGSLFKFMYQIDNSSENWFTIQSTPAQQVNLHFLKNGIWIHYPFLQELDIYYGKDIFNIENYIQKMDQELGKKLMKMVFQSFETIALNMEINQDFFSFDPNKRIYDIYVITKQVQVNPALSTLGIKKIMAVILSNQDERNQFLDYELSNMEIQQQEHEASFKFDETPQETLEKLKKMELLDDQISDNAKGLPFQFLVNFMVEIKDILTTYSQNLTIQVQRVLNNKTVQIETLRSI